MRREHRKIALSTLIGRREGPVTYRLALWLLRPEALSDVEIANLARLLSDEEVERRSCFLYERDRTLYTAAHGLLRLCLSAQDGRDPQVHRFVAGPHGRPELCEGDPRLDLRFNISHTPGLVAVATAKGLACGVDVEDMTRVEKVADWLASSVLTSGERAAFEALESKARPLRFASLWTLKEAWLKAVGRGLTIEPNEVEITFAQDGSPMLCRPDGDGWELHEVPVGERHRLGLAWRRVSGHPDPLWVVEVVPG
jgi:4'-phosphopantetheinyl transferase